MRDRAEQGARVLLTLMATMLVLVTIPGCSDDPGTGPIQAKWDRETCERCRMMLGDRHHSVQVRHQRPNGRSRVRFFDDIGCALIWLEDKPFKEDAATEIWVNDWRSGDWIDARKATYLTGQVTPMEYGLGAQPEPVRNGLDLEQAKAHVWEIERRFNLQGAHLQEAAAAREAASANMDRGARPIESQQGD